MKIDFLELCRQSALEVRDEINRVFSYLHDVYNDKIGGNKK